LYLKGAEGGTKKSRVKENGLKKFVSLLLNIHTKARPQLQMLEESLEEESSLIKESYFYESGFISKTPDEQVSSNL
jgi:hypothetical protein